MADYYDFDFGYTPTTDFSSGADYSFDSGGSYGLQGPNYTPSYTPSNDYSAGADYGFTPSGGTGGQGLQAPSYNFGYTPSYGDFGSFGAGGNYAPTQGAYWDTVFSAGSPVGNYGLSAGTGAPTLQAGTGAAGLQGPTMGAGPQLAATPAVGNAGVTGDFGNLGQTAESALGGIEAWGRQNPRLASLLTQGVGLLANASAQRRANDLMKQQLAMQQRQNEQQQQVFAKNTGIADMRNQLAQQQVNQALSLYNPQELGQRGMAQQQATTGRQLQQIEQQMASRGYSPADIAAAKRRAQVGGALNATQGYMQGYDTGRSAQQGALSSAVGLGQQYGAAPTPADMSQAATALSTMGTQAGQNYASMLGGLLGNPTYEATKRTQESSAAATRRRLGLPAQ